MRVQRTRSASLRSPLTRGPLGTRSLCVAVVAVVLGLGLGCKKDSPTQPAGALPLTGRWAADISGPICVGDWRSVVLDLTQTGVALSGEITTRDGQVFSVSGTIESDLGTLTVTIPGVGECQAVGLSIAGVDRTQTGQPVRFFGEAHGRCCNTVSQQYEFVRVPGA